MITVNDLSVTRHHRTVLQAVTLSAQGPTLTGILGPNGAGKSTLLKALYRALELEAGAETVTGDITISGAALAGMSRRQIARELAVVNQHEPDHVGLRAIDVVALGRTPFRRGMSFGWDSSSLDDDTICRSALDRVDAGALAFRYFAELSGGEQQRVVIARAIAQQASHLLLDEPTNHLDIRHQFELLELVKQLQLTSVAVLHDLNHALHFCDDVVVLDDGVVVAAGPPSEVLTAELIASVWGVEVECIDTARGRRVVVLGPPTVA